MTTHTCFYCTETDHIRTYAQGPDTIELCPECARREGRCPDCGEFVWSGATKSGLCRQCAVKRVARKAARA